MRRVDWLMLILLAIVAFGGKTLDVGSGAKPQHDNPRRPNPENFEPRAWDAETQVWRSERPQSRPNEILDHTPLPREGEIMDDGQRRSSTGSAFSISRQGLWLTARHVAEGCDILWLQTGPKKGLKVRRTVLHPSADVALLDTFGGPVGLPFTDNGPYRGSDSFNIGFPKGRPGAVHARFIGQMTLRHGGRNGYRERVNVWSEQSRIPGHFGSLGGLSGGAVLDSSGRIVGVVEAESRRRGRIMTAQLSSIRDVMARAGVTANAGPAAPAMSGDDYPAAARGLITTLRVARVVCRVERSL